MKCDTIATGVLAGGAAGRPRPGRWWCASKAPNVKEGKALIARQRPQGHRRRGPQGRLHQGGRRAAAEFRKAKGLPPAPGAADAAGDRLYAAQGGRKPAAKSQGASEKRKPRPSRRRSRRPRKPTKSKKR